MPAQATAAADMPAPRWRHVLIIGDIGILAGDFLQLAGRARNTSFVARSPVSLQSVSLQ
jgi:hypothetical protein